MTKKQKTNSLIGLGVVGAGLIVFVLWRKSRRVAFVGKSPVLNRSFAAHPIFRNLPQLNMPATK
jgi:hypothetical protein